MKKENLKRNLIKTAGAIALTGAILGTSGCASKEEKQKKEETKAQIENVNDETKFYIELRTELRNHGCATPNMCSESALYDYYEVLEAINNNRTPKNSDYRKMIEDLNGKADEKKLKKLIIERALNEKHNHAEGSIDGINLSRPDDKDLNKN